MDREGVSTIKELKASEWWRGLTAADFALAARVLDNERKRSKRTNPVSRQGVPKLEWKEFLRSKRRLP
jgi:hypothetical protein